MIELTTYGILLLPEALLIIGVFLLSIALRNDEESEMHRRRGAFGIGSVMFFSVLILLVGSQDLLLSMVDLSSPVRFFPIDSTSGVDAGLLVHDMPSIFFKSGIALLGLVASASAWRRDRRSVALRDSRLRFQCGLFGCALAGFLLTSANDLLIIWGGIEILVLSLRHLIPSERSRFEMRRYGGFFSALILFGILLFYGLFGTTELFAIVKILSTRNVETVPSNALLIASFLIFGGAASRIGGRLVEVVHNARNGFSVSAIALYLLVLLAAYALCVRVTVGVFPADLQGLRIDTFLAVLWALIGIGCASLAAGTNNIYRGIYYAAGAHLAIALLPLAARSEFGLVSGAAYVAVHLLLTLGTAAAIRGTYSDEWNGNFDELSSRKRTRGAVSLLTFVLLLSSAGLPFSVGFMTRFFLLDSMFQAPGASSLSLTIAILVSVLLLYSYGRWLYALYLPGSIARRPAPSVDNAGGERSEPTRYGGVGSILLGLCIIGVILSGTPPGFRLVWSAIQHSLGLQK